MRHPIEFCYPYEPRNVKYVHRCYELFQLLFSVSRYRDVWSPKARHWVSEWLTIGAGNSEGTSGIGSMTASYAGKLENDPLMTTFFHRKRRNEVRSSPRQILHRRPTEALSLSKTDVAYTSRQNVRVMGHTIQYRTHNRKALFVKHCVENVSKSSCITFSCLDS